MNQPTIVREKQDYPRPWVFYASFPISLLLGVALAPMEFDPNRYLCAYGFGLLCAICYFVAGQRRNRIDWVRYGVGLLYLAPFLPIFIAAAYEALFLDQK